MNLYELLKGSNLAAYVDDEIRLAMQRAVAVETSRGMKITKEKASHKIDIVVALAMAALGAVEHRPKPPAASASADPPVGGYHADRRAVLAGFGRRRF